MYMQSDHCVTGIVLLFGLFAAPITYTERSGSFSNVATSLANPHMLNEGKMSVFDYCSDLTFYLLQVLHSNLSDPQKQ